VPGVARLVEVLIVTGSLLGVFEPKKTMRSVPIQSDYAHVVTPCPSMPFTAEVDAAWQRRAEL
jgi:hypothetical protein